MTGTPTDPKDTPPAELTVSQDRLAAMLAREKDQGGRTAVRSLVERLGFSDSEALEQYLSVVRKAQQDDLSDAQYREVKFTEREKALVAREAAAEARERTAIRRSHLAEAGAKGQDLDDAMALLRVEDDVDDAQLADAVSQLAARRPELFARAAAHLSAVPAPAGAPASVPPSRSPGVSHTPGAAGLEMARRRGLLPPTT
ncbi:hypothetical protein ABZ419_02780 [Streptomyces cinnamoneus]|uniref:hypothetical protein n=1 Tax=Streptomyces cinnamoneus TaxID=53446 RepID=UPI0033FC53D3